MYIFAKKSDHNKAAQCSPEFIGKLRFREVIDYFFQMFTGIL